MSSYLKYIALSMIFASPAAAAPSQEEVDKIIRVLDDKQRNSGDYKALFYLEQKEKDKNDLIYQGVTYRRDTDDKLMILFLKPKSEAGKGYLRIDKNMFMYDPTVGKWERRTERERIGGTGSRGRDFDESRLAEEFKATWIAEEKLGNFTANRIKLEVKPGFDVAYPLMEVWVDKETNNLLKQQDFSLSGRLMRTAYYPKWEKKFSESKKSDIYFPKEIRIFDEVEKGNQTLVVIQQVDLNPLEANIFTKAWLESKSR